MLPPGFDVLIEGQALNDFGFIAFDLFDGVALNTFGFLWSSDNIWYPCDFLTSTTWTAQVGATLTTWTDC